jgi:hypothetical protein
MPLKQICILWVAVEFDGGYFTLIITECSDLLKNIFLPFPGKGLPPSTFLVSGHQSLNAIEARQYI